MNKKMMGVAAVLALLFASRAAWAQDLALGQKIDMSLFTRTNEKLNDPNLTMFRMISPQNSRFLLDGEWWDEITVNALPDGTIAAIQYSKKGISENQVKQCLFLFLYSIPSDTEYTESKDIELGDIYLPRFLKPGTDEGVVFFGSTSGVDIIFNINDRNFERNLARIAEDRKSPSSTPAPASPPQQAEGSISSGSSSSSDSPAPAQSRSRSSSVDFGFTAHLNVYAQGWHQNLASFGIPLQLGAELELPFMTMDFLGEAGAGIGYGNLLEYRFGGMGELYFFNKRIGLGGGAGYYGSVFNLGINASDPDGETIIAYAPPVKTIYYRFALIFRGRFKTTLYSELYRDRTWGFGVMWGRVLTD
jgi:hypothetical protein